jgi:hypothetical protein
MFRKSYRYAAAFILIFSATVAQADRIVAYTDSGSLAAQAGSLSTITFDYLGPGGVGADFNGDNGFVSIQGVGFQGVSTTSDGGYFYNLSIIDPGGYSFLGLDQGQVLVGGFVGDANHNIVDGLITADLPSGVTAAGVQVGINGSSPATLVVDVVTAAGDHPYTVAVPAGAPGSYIGFTSDSAISQIRINAFVDLNPGQSADILVDNFSFGEAVSVTAPLPGIAQGGLGLMGGWGLMTLVRRRRIRPCDQISN